MGLFDRLLATVLPSSQPEANSASMGPYVPGSAQLRTPGHPTAFILPEERYRSAAQTFGKGNEAGMTVSKPDLFSRLMSLTSPTNRAIASAAGEGPAVVLPENHSHGTALHEGVHALLKSGSQPNPADVAAIIPAEGREALARNYTPEQIGEEVPANAMTDPASLAVYGDNGPAGAPTGRSVAERYLALNGLDPATAAGLRKMWGMQNATH